MVPSSILLDDVRKSYAEDESLLRLMGYVTNLSSQALKSLTPEYRSKIDRYTSRDGLLYYTSVNGDTPRVVIPTHNDLRLCIMYERHDSPTGGPRGREMTYLTVSRDFYWRCQYKIVRKCVLVKSVNG